MKEYDARRHLDESQRAMVAARLATLQRGRPSAEKAPIGGITQDSAAERLSVGERSVQRARIVLDAAVPELVRAVDQGKIAVSAAAKLASLPEKKQAEAVELVTTLPPSSSSPRRGSGS